MSEVSTYKICPECGVEHTQRATRCADCDVELVWPHDLPEEEDEPAVDLPPAAELECVRVAPLPWVRALSDGLADRGVAHRVEPAQPADAPEGQNPDVFGDVRLFGLYVESEHLDGAREVDGSIATQVLPEEAPALEDGEEATCPACGTELGADATECPDCGLVLG